MYEASAPSVSSLEVQSHQASPAFSLIVATLRRDDQVARLLTSLLASRTEHQFEVVLVDQDATDSLSSTVSRFCDRLELHHLRVPNVSANHARNLAAKRARYEWLTFPDDDCEFFANTLTVACRIASDPLVQAFSGVFLDDEWKSPEIKASFRQRQRFPRIFLPIANEATLYIRKATFASLGGFDERFGPGAQFASSEGTDLIIRMLRRDRAAQWRYVPDLRVRHALKGPPWDRAAAERMERMGYGCGGLLAKHAQASYLVEQGIRVCKFILLSATVYQGWQARAFSGWAHAFVRGFVDYRKGAETYSVTARMSPLLPRRDTSMLDRILHYRTHRSAGALLAPLLDAMRRIRDTSDVLAVAPRSTAYVWLGVNRATHALFPDRVLELPQAIAHSRECDLEMQELSRHMAALDFSQIILSGFPACGESLARRLRERGVRVGCLFHGPLSECGQDRLNSELFATILRLCREGVIAKLACNKKGLPETIERLAGIRAYKFMVPTRVRCGAPLAGKLTGGPHIGVLAADLFRKNIHNQVAAALLIDGATVHVSGRTRLDYWNCSERLVRYPDAMPHENYVDVLGRMDLNLHLSFSESWGQITAESLAMGVPCMIANHSDIYDYDPVLRDRLVSPNFDRPDELAIDIAAVLKEREALAERGRRYVNLLNQKAEAYLWEFLEQ